MTNSSFNIFTELNTDSHPVNTKNTVMVDAINVALTTRGQNQLILQNMEGTDAFSALPFGSKPLGVAVFNNISYILSGVFDQNGGMLSCEIGTFPSPDWGNLNLQNPINPNFFLPIKKEYSPLKNFYNGVGNIESDKSYNFPFSTKKLNFRSDRLIEVEIQPSYDDSVNIVFTDDYNPIRLVNSRFRVHESGKKAALADRRQVKDTNTYSEGRFGAIRLIKRSDIIPTLTFNGVFSGGYHTGGGYRFFFKYTDSDGALTDIIEESRLVVMAYDDHGATELQNTGKLARFTLTNLDQKFSGVRVFFSYAVGIADTITTVHEILNIYDISDTSLVISIYGNEETNLISADVLNSDYSSIGTVKTITQYDDRLLLGNITNTADSYDQFKIISQSIKISEAKTDMVIVGAKNGYSDPDNVYHKLGVWAGETYELGIVYILTGGRGNTPVMPIRGGDNYDNQLVYTGTNTDTVSATKFGSDGFKSGSTAENRLGVYRTHKNRVMLKKSAVETDTTEVRYLTLDLSAVKQNPYVLANTSGFFIVRKERKRDCVVQGYITNTTKVPVPSKISSTRFKIDTPFIEWYDGGAKHIQSLREGIGKQSDLNKILPAPGRIWETHIDLSQPDLVQTWNRTVSMQGKLQYDQDYNNRNDEQFYAFYAADQLANPAIMATTFNNTTKGVLINNENNPVKATSFVVDHIVNTGNLSYSYNSQVVITNTNASPSAGEMQFENPPENSFGNHNVIVTQIPNGNQTCYIKGVMSVYDPTILSPNISTRVDFYLNTTAAGVTTGFMTKQQQVSSPNLPSPIAIDPANTFIPLLYLGMTTAAQGAYITVLPFTETDKNKEITPEKLHFTIKFTGNYTSTPGAISVSSVANTPIKKLDLRPFTFEPQNIANNSSFANEFTMQYVGYGNDAFTNNQFSTIENRNLYYATANKETSTGSGIDSWPNRTSSYIGDVSTGYVSNIVDTANLIAGIFMSSNVQFSEYIGLKAKVGDFRLHNTLNNDKTHVYSEQIFPTNTFNVTGTDLGDYTYRLQDQGFNLAMLANIYESGTNALEEGAWKNRYINSAGSEVYTAVSNRYTWAVAPTNLSVYDGDCYIGHIYKRIMKGLGIPGIDAANDPNAYTDFNQATGLYPKGFVMPIVSENNYNVSLRTFDNFLASEKALYNKDRTFFPLENIDSLRASRQPESTGYNHGYDYDGSDRVYTVLNDRAPSLNINYGNRVMASSVSVSGNFSNGYIDFSGLNFRDYNKQLGQITKLVTHNNTVYCIFEQGVGVLPINQRTMVSAAEGGVFLDNASILAPKMQILSTEYGSDQQFSIIKTDQAVYGCDVKNNKIWRLGNSGDGAYSLDIISDFAIQTILVEFKERIKSNQTNNFVKANYDRERNHVIFSYYNEEFGKFSTNYLEDVIIIPEITVVPDTVELEEFDVRPGTSKTGNSRPEEFGELEEFEVFYGTSNENQEEFEELEEFEVFYGTSNENQEEFDVRPETYNGNRTREEYTAFISPTRVLRKNKIGSVYFNETVQKWISKLSWNPIWMFNIENNLYSFNACANTEVIWNHFSSIVPFSHIYGEQHKFVFEFVLVDKSTAQKIINNLMVISNRIFPGNITYTTLEDDTDYENFNYTNAGYMEYLKQRHETFPPHIKTSTNWAAMLSVVNLPGNTQAYLNIQGNSKEESQRIVGGYVIDSNIFDAQGVNINPNATGELYVIGDSLYDAFTGISYNEILDQNRMNVTGLPNLKFTTIDFGIIKQNMEYIEDHLYIEVGKDDNSSYVRDKAIKIKFEYEGYDYVTIQAIISSFVYSFN